MTRTNLYTGAARWALLIGLAALPLAGCKPAASPSDASSAPSSALPLADSGAPIAPAPPISDLPPAPPIPVGHLASRDDYYAFADHAYAVNEAFGDAPPDYQYDYDGAEPWVWRSDNGAMRVAEALAGGGDRYYYYEPGADYPYLVRDPQYSYGYDNGQLVVIYDSSGRVLPESAFEQRRDYASRFYARGRSLYAGSQQQQHQAVAQSNWVARRNAYAAEQQRWAGAQRADSDWQAYHQAHQQQEENQWAGERARRETEAAQFAITINDTQAAQRDRDAAQRAQQRAQSAPPPPQGGIFHFGGPQHPGGDQGQPPPAGGGQPPHPGPVVGPAGAPAGPSGEIHRQDHAGAPTPETSRQQRIVPGGASFQPGQPPHRDLAQPGQTTHAVVEPHQAPPASHGGGLAGAIAAHVEAQHPPVVEAHVVEPHVVEPHAAEPHVAAPGPKAIEVKPAATPKPTAGTPAEKNAQSLEDLRRNHRVPPAQ
jgi:hypothetical protein